MSYIGAEPIVSATRTITELTATAGQTVFVANGGYTVGYIDVFLNGAQLQTSDFTASNGSSITLTEAAQTGDVIRLVAWGTFSTSTSVARAGDTMTGDLTLNNGSADGAQLVLASSGYDNWNLDNFNGRFRAYNGSTERMTIDASGNVGIGTASGTGRFTVDYTAPSAFTNAGGDFVSMWRASGTNALGVAANTTGSVVRLVTNNGYQLAFNDASTELMRLDSSGNLRFNSGYGSVATAFGCRAWVNFNGTGTVAIRSSGNVSSITDNGTGRYNVNFTNAMPDTNYVVVSGTWDINVPGTVYSRPSSTSACTVEYYSGSTSTDDSNARIAIFR